SLDFLICGVLIAPADVVVNRSCKQHIFLEYHRNLIAERVQLVIPYIHISYFYSTFLYVITSGDQLYQGRLCASGDADHTEQLSSVPIKNKDYHVTKRDFSPRAHNLLLSFPDP